MELVSRKKSSDGDEVWRKIIDGSKTIRVEKGLIAQLVQAHATEAAENHSTGSQSSQEEG